MAFRDQNDLSSLHPQTKRYVEKRILRGKRNGLHLDQETRDKLQVGNVHAKAGASPRIFDWGTEPEWGDGFR